MIKVSLVIPHYPSEQTDAALDKCLASFEGQYDELMLVVNDGIGYGQAVNLGLKYCTGDYIIVSNNDIILKKGELRYLAWPSSITVPLIDPPAKDHMPRAIFGMPKNIYEKIIQRDGFFYDPIFEIGYWEDDDLIRRLEDIPVILDTGILVEHTNGGGMTMKQMGEQKWHDINKKVFENKWPDTYS